MDTGAHACGAAPVFLVLHAVRRHRLDGARFVVLRVPLEDGFFA